MDEMTSQPWRERGDQTADILDRLGTPEQRRDYALAEAARKHREANQRAQQAADIPAAVRTAGNEYEASQAAIGHIYQAETKPPDPEVNPYDQWNYRATYWPEPEAG